MLKILQARLQEWTENFWMYKLGLEKAEEPEIKLSKITGSRRKQGDSRKISTSPSLISWKPLTVWFNKLWEIIQEMEYHTTLGVSWKTCVQDKKQQLEPDMEQRTGSKLGKEYSKI